MLVSVRDAAAVLGLRSRGSVYRKIQSGELPSVPGPDGPMVERDGLEEVWSRITRKRSDSPRPRRERPAGPLRPAAERMKPRKVVETVAEEEGESDEVPDFNEERARHEKEKRLIAEMERKQKAKELVYREDYDQAQKATALYLSGQIEALPRQIRQQLPHLTANDEEVIEQLIYRLLNQVADWRMDREEVAA